MAESAILLGASGLTGSYLLRYLLQDDYFTEVNILVRKKIDLTHPKLKQTVVDFNNTVDFQSSIGKSDIIFCCIGTTMKKVKGDRKLYKQIDVDIPVNAAKFGAENGVRKFLLVSAIGANAKSSIFYKRIKGLAENGVKNSGIPSIYIFRPSLLTGRINKRRGERFAEIIMKILDPFMIGSLRKYHSMPATKLAYTMLNTAKKESMAVRVLYY